MEKLSLFGCDQDPIRHRVQKPNVVPSGQVIVFLSVKNIKGGMMMMKEYNADDASSCPDWELGPLLRPSRLINNSVSSSVYEDEEIYSDQCP